MRTSVSTVAVLLSLLPVLAAEAQSAVPGAVEGTVQERSVVRSVRSARVSARMIGLDTSFQVSAQPDGHGRYRIDSLPPGRYRVRTVSASLDSLGVAPPATDVLITPGRVVLADFTLPAGPTLRDAVCGRRLGAGRGAVVGRALDADADGRPLAGARLLATWMEFPVDRTTRRSTPTRRVTEVPVGAEGGYRLCDVPTETLFTLQLRNHGRAGTAVTAMVTEDEGVIARDLSLSAQSAPTILVLDSLERAAAQGHRAAPRAELQGVGTAELAGTVRGITGEPFVGATVRVRDARATTLTDSAGRFVLRELPAGTQRLVAQHPGYEVSELAVELRPGTRVEQAVLLVRPLALEAIQTTAALVPYETFDANRRMNWYGQYLTLEEIDKKKHAAETVDLFDDLLGFTAFGHGSSARLVSNVALARGAECSSASVVIQGAEGRRINDVRPGQIAGIEAYPDASFVPAKFASDAACGVIVIWLRKSTRAMPRPDAGLRANGYP